MLESPVIDTCVLTVVYDVEVISETLALKLDSQGILVVTSSPDGFVVMITLYELAAD